MLYIVKQLKSLLNFYVSAGLNEGGVHMEYDLPSVKEMSEKKEYSKEQLDSFKKYLEITDKIGDLKNASKTDVKTVQMLLDVAGKKLSNNPNSDGIDGIVGNLTLKADAEYKNEAKLALSSVEKAQEKEVAKKEIISESKAQEKEVKKDVESNEKPELKTQVEVKTEKSEKTNESINENLLSEYKNFIAIDSKIGGIENANKGQIMVLQGLLKGKYELGKFGPNEDGVDGYRGESTDKAYFDYKTKALDYIAKAESNKNVEVKTEVKKEVEVKDEKGQDSITNNLYIESYKEVNKESLIKFIESNSIDKIENILKELNKINERKKDINPLENNDFNNLDSEKYSLFKDNGYEPNGVFGTGELGEIVTVLNRYLLLSGGKATHEKIREIKGVNNKSLKNLFLNENNLKDFYEKLTKDNSEDLLESKGYNFDSWFMHGDEIESIKILTKGIVETQEKIKGLNFRDKIAILLDYNADGLLDNEQNFETQEMKFFEAIKSEKDFNNILIDLGYKGGISEFDEKFSTNYFAERVNFKTRLKSILDMKIIDEKTGNKYYLNINPVEMMIYENAVENRINLFKETMDEIEKNDKFKKLEAKDKKIANQLKAETIAIVLGESNGFGLSYDVREMTKNLLDTVSVGVFNGILGIAFAKRIIETENGKFNLDLGAVNFIPYLAGGVKLVQSEIDEFKSIFPNEVETNADITFVGALSKVNAVGLVFDRIDENTSAGIERMAEKMSHNLDVIFKNIRENKEFKDLGIEENNKNIEAYNALKNIFESAGSTEIAENAIKNGALNTYRNELYKNAEGFNFSGVGIGLVGTFGYITPILGVKFEEIEISYVEKPRASYVSLPDTYAEGVDVLDPVFKEKVNALGDTITFRTRTNRYAEQILNPSRTLEDRWQGLINYSNRKGKYSPELTKTMNAFKEMVSYAEKDGASKEEKWYVISTVSQFMKKSNDYNNGDLDKWNTETEKLIKTDEERRWHFDGLMGMSLNEEAKEYYEKLSKSSGKIGRTTIEGVGFDSMSTLNVEESKKALKGVEVLYANLSILTVDGEPLLVKIENDSKIKGFVEKLKTIPMEESIRQNLIKSIESGDTELFFYKDPEGFDDRILPMIKGETRETIPVYKQVNEVTDYLFGYAGKKHNVDDKSKGNNNNNTTDPDNPNTGSGGSGNTSGGAGQGNTGNNNGGGGGVQIP